MKLVSSYFPSAVQDMNEITEYFDTHTDIVMDNVSTPFPLMINVTLSRPL
ncbi:MAG: hypothetical protein LBT89_11530 [Planctomycetaceae bacterium]|jgi:hypothetical protein|nr:hypothetical protein [Planctomycetaceae bacterium]